MSAPEMETVACDLCGSDQSVPVLQLRDLMFGTTDQMFQLVRCERCHLLFLNPRPASEDLGRFYPAEYAPFRRRGLSARMKLRGFRQAIDDLWELLKPPARVLELGCATGELLRTIRDRGNPAVIGVEPSVEAARIARQRWGLDVRAGTLEEAALAAGSIDIALLSHVLEHVSSPSATLAELHRILRPSGTLVLWLPNADSWAARALGRYWMGYDAPRHLYDFSATTLAQLLWRQGFVVEAVRHEWIGLEWSWGLRLLVRSRWPASPLNRLLTAGHPLMTAACSPLSALAAGLGRAGRIQVVARRVEPA